MTPSYPIFLKDRDEWMCMICDEEQLNTDLESIDIEDNEYQGWDINGIPVKPYLEQKQIKLKVLSDQPQEEQLRNAIFKYANLARKGSFVYAGDATNLKALFQSVEEYIAADTLTQKIKRALKKFISRNRGISHY